MNKENEVSPEMYINDKDDIFVIGNFHQVPI